MISKKYDMIASYFKRHTEVQRRSVIKYFNDIIFQCFDILFSIINMLT